MKSETPKESFSIVWDWEVNGKPYWTSCSCPHKMDEDKKRINREETVVCSLNSWRDPSPRRCDAGTCSIRLTHTFNCLQYFSFPVQAPCLDCLILPICNQLLAFPSLLTWDAFHSRKCCDSCLLSCVPSLSLWDTNKLLWFGLSHGWP